MYFTWRKAKGDFQSRMLYLGIHVKILEISKKKQNMQFENRKKSSMSIPIIHPAFDS